MSLYHLYVPPSCCRQQPGGFFAAETGPGDKGASHIHGAERAETGGTEKTVASADTGERFAILGTLLDEYRSFNTDSALHMAEEREQIAIRLGNREYIDNARMNKADVLGMTGMYKEVMDLMRNIHIDRLPVDIHPYYYHIYRTVYGRLCRDGI